jgi:hypothetical protein
MAQPHRRFMMKKVKPEAGREDSITRNARASAEAPNDNDPGRRIAALHSLTAQQLREEWRRLYRGQPPRFSRDLLIRSLAYRLQELAYGGLSKATQRQLASLASEMATKGTVTVTADVRLRPGARLMREWRGKTHTVIVRDDGFELAGTVYPSLTQIAHRITGAHWSGPRFFGLNRKPASTGEFAAAAAESTAEGAAHA